MRRSVVLALSVALIVLVFAPIAAAQTNYRGGGNQGMSSGGMDDIGMDHNNMGMDPNMMDSTASSASTTAMSSASAPSFSATSSATTAPSNELPDTGGIPLAPCCRLGRLSCWRAPASSRPD
jgi:uncharacterized protein involved in copper resistance